MDGVIFDFNGTMFQDSDFHEKAWIEMIKKYSNKSISDTDIVLNIHGRTNVEIITYFISKKITQNKIEEYSKEKEKYYRELCLKNPERLILTKGLEKTLDWLKANDIPITIATATVKENVDFYFDIFNLTRWFNYDKVVYDNGLFPGKPDPTIFLIAAQKLNLSIEKCIVIEDAYSGIVAANKANAGKIILIDPKEKNRKHIKEKNVTINYVIKNFDEFPFKELN